MNRETRIIAAKGIDDAVAVLAGGGVVAFPTETFYGLAADATNAAAVDRIFALKGRSFSNPIALIIAREEELPQLTEEITDVARKLMAAFWPGPLTLVFKARPEVNSRLTADTGKIGVRISSHPVAQALAAGLGHPITATSANLSGHPECTTAAEVRSQMGRGKSLPSGSTIHILDAGTTPGGRGSTFLDLTSDPPAVLREGAIPGSALVPFFS
jgi:L-threonylcarbamoyladenylate synthase